MHKHLSYRRQALLAVLAAGLVAALGAAGSSAAVARQVHVVATAHNAQLGKTVLVTTNGRTLYSLSVERKGKFICTNAACLSFWKPLLVAKGTTPTGVAGLGTVVRPGQVSRVQVTFRGAPLYTFTGDKKRGDAKGDGFKDVGVWHAASTTAASQTTSTGGGGYGSGGYGSGYGR
jgi:predicted lipoprotein with Yx(FWY)xxD motif